MHLPGRPCSEYAMEHEYLNNRQFKKTVKTTYVIEALLSSEALSAIRADVFEPIYRRWLLANLLRDMLLIVRVRRKVVAAFEE